MKQRRKPYIIHQTQSISYLPILSYLDLLKHLAQPEILLHHLIVLLLPILQEPTVVHKISFEVERDDVVRSGRVEEHRWRSKLPVLCDREVVQGAGSKNVSVGVDPLASANSGQEM